MNVQLLHQTLPVFFNRLDADAKFRGRRLISLAFGNQLQDFHLARTQARALVLQPFFSIRRFSMLILKMLRNGGAKESVSLFDFPNCLRENVGGGLFEQKSRRARSRRSLDVCVITVRGKNKNLGGGNRLENL